MLTPPTYLCEGNQVTRNPVFAGSVLALLTAAHPSLSAQQPAVSNDALLKRIEELEHQVKVLSQGNEAKEKAVAEKAKSAVTASIGASGFQIRTADTNFMMRIRGYIQADSRWFIGDEVPVNDTFLIRRARPIIEGTVFSKFDYRLQLDFGSGVTSSTANNSYLQDAYMNARLWPQFQVQAGKFKEPTGLERLQSGANLLFVERAFPSQLTPNRDVGVQLQGDISEGLLTYAAGVFNGVADGGSTDIDRNDDEKDFAARIFAHPFKNSSLHALNGLGIGLAGTYGNQFGALRSYSTPGQQNLFSYYSGTGTAPSTTSDGTVWRLIPQAYYYWRSLGVLAEYAVSSAEVVRTGGITSSADLQHTAWQVALSYFVTGEENSYKPVTPLKPFALRSQGWGAFEVAARVSQLKLDDETFPTYASDATSAREALATTFGINWHLNRNFKLQLNYEHTDFQGGDANPVLEDSENVVLTRAQLSF